MGPLDSGCSRLQSDLIWWGEGEGGHERERERERGCIKESLPSVTLSRDLTCSVWGSDPFLTTSTIRPQHHPVLHPISQISHQDHPQSHPQPQDHQLVNQIPCCCPVGCLSLKKIPLNDLSTEVKVICSNINCQESSLMHLECFTHWESLLLSHLRGTGRTKHWTEKQRVQTLWTKKGYDLTYKVCGCICGKGHIRKDQDWVMATTHPEGTPPPPHDGHKRRRNRRGRGKSHHLSNVNANANGGDNLMSNVVSNVTPQPHLPPQPSSHLIRSLTISSSHRIVQPNIPNPINPINPFYMNLNLNRSPPFDQRTSITSSSSQSGVTFTSSLFPNPMKGHQGNQILRNNLSNINYHPNHNHHPHPQHRIATALPPPPPPHPTVAPQMSYDPRGRSSSLSSAGSTVGEATSESCPSSNGSVSDLSPAPTIMSGSSGTSTSLSAVTSSCSVTNKVAFSTESIREKREKSMASRDGIFCRRHDYSTFNALPRTKINSYHIRMEEDGGHGSHGNDDIRNLIMDTVKAAKTNRVHCILCHGSMMLFDRFPLIDGTFFLSPKGHGPHALPVVTQSPNVLTSSGPRCLNAVCMGCLEGQGVTLTCRGCSVPWTGSSLTLGSMYTYDIFAAVPCCVNRLRCNSCHTLVYPPDRRLEFFSDYTQRFDCTFCGHRDHHFVKDLNTWFTSCDRPIIQG